MRRSFPLLSLFSLVLFASSARAQTVPVPGSEFSFEEEIVENFHNRPVTLRLTGVGLRERFFIDINAYSVGSYVDKSAKVSTPAELAKADVPKILHLKVERGFKGKKLAEVLEKGIRRNHPGNRFDAELKGFMNYFKDKQVQRNDDAFFIHVPGEGLRYRMSGDTEMQIPNVEFANAVWEIYFGEHPVNPKIKQSLAERL